MTAEEQPVGEEVTEAVYLDDLAFDWTEGVAIDDEVVQWALVADLPANVDGIDYSRAVSRPADGSETVG